MPQSDLPHDPHLTAIAIAYQNPDTALIADSVLPRTPVGDVAFQYTNFNDPYKAYTVPNTAVGPRGKLNRLELSGQRVPAMCEDQGLELPLSFYDTRPGGNTTPSGVKRPDAKQQATQLLTSLILLRREVRVAQMVFNAALYPAGFKELLAGTDQWDDPAYAKNAVKTISRGLDKPLVRPNVLVFGAAAWTIFRALPDVVQAGQGNAGESGLVSRQRVAELFEVQEVLVGQAWHNTAKPGEAPALSRAWGKDVAAFYRDRAAGSTGGLTFGFTAEFGQRVAMVKPDSDIGLRGGEVVRVGETVQEVVCAPQAAYFWEDVIN